MGQRINKILKKDFAGKTIRRQIREFADIFAIIALVITSFIIYKASTFTLKADIFLAIAVVLIITGRKIPIILYPFWFIWMKFANVLNKVMTFVLMLILWLLMFIPISICLKLFRKKVIDVKLDKNIKSYWESRPTAQNDFKNMERQF